MRSSQHLRKHLLVPQDAVAAYVGWVGILVVLMFAVDLFEKKEAKGVVVGIQAFVDPRRGCTLDWICSREVPPAAYAALVAVPSTGDRHCHSGVVAAISPPSAAVRAVALVAAAAPYEHKD